MRKKRMETGVVVNLVKESVFSALSSLKNDRFRTVLSLSGISVGIFTMVMVFCIVDALQADVRKGLSAVGQEVFYVMQEPWETGGTFRWWEYRQRPPVRESEFEFIRRHSRTAGGVAFLSTFQLPLRRGEKCFGGGHVIAASSEIDRLSPVHIAGGRKIAAREYSGGVAVAMVGHEVARLLFEGEDPVGKEIRVGGHAVQVVGVLEKAGESLASVFDPDHAVILPLRFGKTLADLSVRGGMILAAPGTGTDRQVLEAELGRLMRTCRKLSPGQDDDFAVNRMTFLLDSIDEVMDSVNGVGWVIGAFSLLIGGFGIANIMFVSVKERTSQIGLQKALGAKRYFILTHFLVESAVLSVAGGLVGILLAALSVHGVGDNESFPISLSWGNAAAGLFLSLSIGLISGLLPARSASSLDPVRAIN